MKHIYLVILALVISGFASGAAYANRDCYSSTQAEAEQGLRIHSELMVIGLNCQHMGARQGMNLYGDYRALTARYSDLFSSYEKILINYFEANGVANPEARLNTLRTKFANKISKDVATMRPDLFCSRYAPRVSAASAMSKDDLRRWASTIYPSHPVSRPLCSPQARQKISY